MKELDKRIEDWAKLLVKPQEVNQARLFAIETRLKETEDFRVREITFVKDALKKTIFALEQAEISKTMTPSVIPLDKVGSPFASRGRPSNPTAEDMPPLPHLMNSKNRAHSQVANVTPMKDGYDVLFLKRLLYIKAAID